jgi:hypothetical protein
VFLICLIFSFIWWLASFASAEIPRPLANFLQHAVPDGEIRYGGAFTIPPSVYHVFTLRQSERRGVLLVQQTGQTGFAIVGADTSLDSFPKETPDWDGAVRAAAWLLNQKDADPLASRTAASVEDVCPLGAALNTFLVPIAGFALSSNGTLGILRDLQHADAYAVEPECAPPGSILVSPSQFAAQGPVVLGFAVIVGPDRYVYGPDYRHGGAWHRLATLSEFLRANESVSNVSGFLLRAKEKERPGVELGRQLPPPL